MTIAVYCVVAAILVVLVVFWPIHRRNQARCQEHVSTAEAASAAKYLCEQGKDYTVNYLRTIKEEAKRSSFVRLYYEKLKQELRKGATNG